MGGLRLIQTSEGDSIHSILIFRHGFKENGKFFSCLNILEKVINYHVVYLFIHMTIRVTVGRLLSQSVIVKELITGNELRRCCLYNIPVGFILYIFNQNVSPYHLICFSYISLNYKDIMHLSFILLVIVDVNIKKMYFSAQLDGIKGPTAAGINCLMHFPSNYGSLNNEEWLVPYSRPKQRAAESTYE